MHNSEADLWMSGKKLPEKCGPEKSPPKIAPIKKSLMDIKHLFVYNKLVNIKDWFTANKLSLNVEKTKYSLLNKPSKKDDISLRLPNL